MTTYSVVRIPRNNDGTPSHIIIDNQPFSTKEQTFLDEHAKHIMHNPTEDHYLIAAHQEPFDYLHIVNRPYTGPPQHCPRCGDVLAFCYCKQEQSS